MGKNNKPESPSQQPPTSNGEANNGEVAKAFDTLAKAVQPQGNSSEAQVSLYKGPFVTFIDLLVSNRIVRHLYVITMEGYEIILATILWDLGVSILLYVWPSRTHIVLCLIIICSLVGNGYLYLFGLFEMIPFSG